MIKHKFMDFDDLKKTHVLNGLVFVLKMKKKKNRELG